MIVLTDTITDSEICDFKKYFQSNLDKKYVNWQCHDHDIVDHRLVIDPDCSEFDIIRAIVSKNFAAPRHIWAAYQKQSQPHQIHIDDYGSEHPGAFRYTYIIAMDTVPEFKAIVWKETCWDNNELHRFVAQWGRTRKFIKAKSSISETQDLEHTWDANQEAYMCDSLTLDGIYTYKTGTACLFDATQLHCTNNWRKYKKFTHRELLQIHVLNSSELDLQSR